MVELLFLTLGGLLKIVSKQIMVYRIEALTRTVLQRIGSAKGLDYVQEVVTRLALNDGQVILWATSSLIGSGLILGAGTYLLSGLMVTNIKPLLFIANMVLNQLALQ